MLVLRRKADEQIRIGDRVTITVLRSNRGSVSLGIDAPRDLRILRTELESRPSWAGRRKGGSHGPKHGD